MKQGKRLMQSLLFMIGLLFCLSPADVQASECVSENGKHDWYDWEVSVNDECESYYDNSKNHEKVLNCHGGEKYRWCYECFEEESVEIKGNGCKFISNITKKGYAKVPRCTICKCEWSAYNDNYGNRYNELMDYANSYSYDKYSLCKIKIVSNKTQFIENGKTQRPKLDIYVCVYEYGEYVGRFKISDKQYSISYRTKGKKAGTHKFDIKFNNKKYSGTVEGSYKIKANPLTKKNITLKKGKTFKLQETGKLSHIKWKSSNDKVATVSAKGVVKAKGAGTCKITAKYRGKTYTCKVTVKKPKVSKPKPQQKPSSSTSSSSGTVYWVASGKVYHSTDDCPTLSRSRNIYSGSKPSGRRACKVCH